MEKEMSDNEIYAEIYEHCRICANLKTCRNMSFLQCQKIWIEKDKADRGGSYKPKKRSK